MQRPTTKTSTTPSILPSPPIPLDPLRLKLVQLIDQLASLQSQLFAHSQSTALPTTLQPGIPPFAELLSRFNILLSHTIGLRDLLSSVGKEGGGQGQGKGKGDKRKEGWEANVVVPGVVVDESRDWLVGMLLRTKQTPLVEAHLSQLLTSLPPSFPLPPIPTPHSTSTYANSLSSHLSLISHASTRISELKEGLGGEEGEWDWKARVEIDQDEEEDSELQLDQEVQVVEDRTQNVAGAGERRAWSVEEVARFLRTGERPDI